MQDIRLKIMHVLRKNNNRLRDQLWLLRSEVKSLRNVVREQSNKDTLLITREDEDTPDSIRETTAENEENKVETISLQGR